MRKRQRVRRLILFLSLLLFPVTINFFSPYIIIMGASEGIINGSFILFTLMLLLSPFVGRGFCGWLCPAGGAQEILIEINPKPVRKLKWIKYVIWAVWLSMILMLFSYAKGIKSIQPFYLTESGISIDAPVKYIIYYGVLFLVIGLPLLFGKRGMCHYLCWMAPFMNIGKKIGQIINAPQLKVTIDASKCIACGKCTKVCPMSIEVQEIVTNNSCIKHIDCILCLNCVDICPKAVLKL